MNVFSVRTPFQNCFKHLALETRKSISSKWKVCYGVLWRYRPIGPRMVSKQGPIGV